MIALLFWGCRQRSELLLMVYDPSLRAPRFAPPSLRAAPASLDTLKLRDAVAALPPREAR